MFNTLKRLNSCPSNNIKLNVIITHIIPAQFYEQSKEKRVDNETHSGIFQMFGNEVKFCLMCLKHPSLNRQ